MLTGCKRSGLDDSGFTFPFSKTGLNSRILNLMFFSLVFSIYCLFTRRKRTILNVVNLFEFFINCLSFHLSKLEISRKYAAPYKFDGISQGHYIEDHTGLSVAVHTVNCCDSSPKPLFRSTDHNWNV